MDLPQNELKMALIPLADYLLEVSFITLVDSLLLFKKRSEYNVRLEQHQKAKQDQRKDLLLGSKEVARLRDGLELVCTLLLKCNLKARPTLITSFLNRSGQNCILEEAERDLKEANLLYELKILYDKKGRHEEALKLLKEQAHVSGSPLSGVEHTIEYLQELGEEHLSLVFEYSKWVLTEDLDKGIQIFCSTNDNVKKWDCDEVLDFLKHDCLPAIIPYLEHVIHVLEEKRPNFHETLAEQYIVKVKKLMKDYIHVLGDSKDLFNQRYCTWF